MIEWLRREMNWATAINFRCRTAALDSLSVVWWVTETANLFPWWAFWQVSTKASAVHRSFPLKINNKYFPAIFRHIFQNKPFISLILHEKYLKLSFPSTIDFILAKNIFSFILFYLKVITVNISAEIVPFKLNKSAFIRMFAIILVKSGNKIYCQNSFIKLYLFSLVLF